MSKNGMGEVEVASAVSSSFGAGTEMVSFSGLLGQPVTCFDLSINCRDIEHLLPCVSPYPIKLY